MKTIKIQRLLLSFLCLLLLLTVLPAAAEEDSRWEVATSVNEEGNTVIDFQEVEFILPEDWVSQIQIEISHSVNRADVYLTSAREKWTEGMDSENDGFLFGIVFREDAVEDSENILLIGHTAEGYYYMYFPTDDRAYTKDPDTAEAYKTLWDDIDWIKDHCKLTVESVSEVSEESDVEDEYIIPNSSDTYLTEADLAGMDADEVQMAINEIYARHGRKFLMQDVQDYFDQQSWYSGTIDAEKFTQDVFNRVMNDYEKANIDMMDKYKNRIF